MFTKTNIVSAILVSVLTTIASQNNICVLNDKTNGTCVPLPNCQSALKLLRNNSETLKHLNCGFDNLVPLVCCTENSDDNVVFESSESTSQAPPSTTPMPKATVARTTMRYIRTTTTTTPPMQNTHKIDSTFPTHELKEASPVFSLTGPTPPPPSLVTRGADLPNRNVCGQTITASDRILGGRLSSIGEFPWAALLKRDKSFGCMGTLINANFVLTAAHCVEKSHLFGLVTEVRLGEWDLETQFDCDETSCSDPVMDVPVSRTITHPNYTKVTDKIFNDIALLQLGHSVNFSDFVRPICLPTTDYVARKDYLNAIQYTAAGWGKTEYASSSVILRKVYLNSVGINVCRAVIPTITEDQLNDIICAGGVRGEDTCNGDSGSGLIKMETEDFKRAWFLYGITSYGSPKCGSEGIPGVYTRVTAYMSWILNTIRHTE